MPTTKQPHPHWRVSALTILFPPLAHLRHRRYQGRPHHLTADTILAVLWLGLLVGNIWLWRHPEWLIPGRIESHMAVVGEVVSGDSNDFTLDLVNTSSHPLTAIEITIAPPPGWQTIEITGASVTDQVNVFQVGTLGSQERRNISISGSFVGTPGQRQSMVATISGLDDEQQIESVATVRWTIKRSVLALEITNPPSVTQGREFIVTAELSNTGSHALANMVIDWELPEGLKIISAAPPLIDNRWRVGDLSAGDTQTMSFHAVLNGGTLKKTAMSAAAKIVIAERDVVQATVTRTFSVQPSTIFLDEAQLAQPNLVAEAHYYSDAGFQFGYGPLPPRVGEETVYRIFWYAQLPAGSDRTATVTSSLPPGTAWRGHPTVTHGAAVQYDAKKRTITWDIGVVDSNPTTMSASFDVAVDPGAEDIGQALLLLRPTVLVLKTAGEDRISVTVPGVTTKLNEAAARNRDRVIP